MSGEQQRLDSVRQRMALACEMSRRDPSGVTLLAVSKKQAMIAEIIVKAAIQKYHVIRICRPNSYHLDGVERVDKPLSNFQLFALILASEKRALIDSSLHHAAAAFNKPSTVMWVGTDPKMFGYDIHDNICAKEPSGNIKRIDSYIFDYDFLGHHHEFPYYSNDIIFDSKQILNSLAL